jgi:hypothetical protein
MVVESVLEQAMSRKRQLEPSWYPGISSTVIPQGNCDTAEGSSLNVRHFLAKTSSLFQELEVDYFVKRLRIFTFTHSIHAG